MTPPSEMSGYSAQVTLDLIHPAGRISLGGVAPDWIMARTPTDLKPCDATLVITIDGKEQRQAVHLPEGMSREKSKTPIVSLAVATPL
jgi:hypothetical protein